MRILILWASLDQPNLGVRALAVGTRAVAAQVYPDAEIQIQGTVAVTPPCPCSPAVEGC
ncbi:hypothetical protein [Actinomyces ruminis]|uniref:hypothetical protein n=1 Tax=Actinomyces ruminis TaxID=1937003 RepID=UPI0015D4A933|nr:hypothetical protein [Actinomyces ruminis]